MTDPNKTTTSWSFGQSGTSGSSNNLFGQAASNTSKPANSLFGSTATPPGSSGANPFASTSTTGGSSLFGAASGSSQAPGLGGGGGGSTNLFGGGSKPAEGGLFGPKSTQDKPPSAAAPSNAFSGFSAFSTPSKPAEPSTTAQSQAPSLFGGTNGGSALNMNSTTPISKPAPSLFGNSTTPAGPPPNATTGTDNGSSIFGSTTAPSGSFKGFDQPSSKPADSSTAVSSMQPPSTLGSSTGNGSSDLFGKRPAQSEGGLFQNLNKAQDTGATKSANGQNEAPKASNPFMLGAQPSAATTTSQASTPSLFGNLGSKPALSFPTSGQSQPSANPTTSPVAKPSPFNLFNKPESSDPSAPPKTTPSLFSSFGKPQDKAQDKDQDKAPGATTEPTTLSTPSLSAAAPAPAPTSSLFNLGKPGTTTTTTKAPDQSTNTTSNQGLRGSSVNLGASTAGPLPTAQSRLKNKSMDDIISRWATDLAKYQKEFQQQAEKVANWDRMLVDNSEKIQKLYGSTLEAERATTEVERQLTAVENDQAELSQWLDHYEKEVDAMISNSIGQDGALSGPDQERERTYQLASRLSERLDEMGKDLTSMIEEINDASFALGKNNKTDDPLSQVVRILNGHLTQLQHIDQGTAALQLKVREAQRAGQTLGPTVGLSGPNSDAADGFYRSYMGRR